MEKSLLALLLLAVGSSFIIGLDGYCKLERDLQNCNNILQPGSHVQDVAGGQQPVLNKTQLIHACSNLQEFFKCYDDLMLTCHDFSLELGNMREGLDKTFDYICGEGRKLYLENNVCMNEDPTKQKIKDCSLKAQNDLKYSFSQEEICNKIDQLSNCVKNAVRHCGDGAVTFFDGFTKKMVGDYSISCGGEGGLSQGKRKDEEISTGATLLDVGSSFTIGLDGYCMLERDLQNCINILQPDIHLQDVVGGQLVWNKTQLIHACSNVQEFFKCYDDLMLTCHDFSLELGYMREGLDKTFDYICGEGRKLYLENNVCTNQDPALQKIKDCSWKAKNDLKFSVSQEEKCNIMDQHSNCVKNAVRHCGDGAVTYFDGFIKKMVADSSISCGGGGGLSQGVIYTIISAVSVTFVIIGFGVRALIIRTYLKTEA